MPKPIKKTSPSPQRRPAVPLPFPPTVTPSHAQVAQASRTLLTMAQLLFQGNPGPTITALKCAENLYIENAEKNGGMPLKDIEEFEVLGIAISKEMLKIVEEEAEKAESGIVTRDSSIVGVDGRPLTLSQDRSSGSAEKMAPLDESRLSPAAPDDNSQQEDKPSGIIINSKG